MTTILFVEDEAPIRDLVRFTLSRAQMEMLDAANGREAEQILQRRRPDLILLDWMLPDESGIDLLRRLRRHPELRAIPVIMVTALAEEEQKVLGLEAGADDYVTKPFSPPELVARVKAVLRRANGIDEEGMLRQGALELDPQRRRVHHGEEPVELGPTEYRLLHFLMSHPRRVYSRGQLLDYVWPDDTVREERTVDVSIRRLRKALQPFGADRLIRTVRGAGYCLDSEDA